MSIPVIAETPRWLRAIPAALAFSGLLIPATTVVIHGQSRTAAGPNDALFQSGRDYFDQGNYAAAEDAFRRLAALEPGNPRAIGGIVEVFLRQNRIDDAINLAQSEVDKNPTQTQLRVTLGNIYVRAGKDDQAIAEFQGAIDNGAKYQAALYFRTVGFLRVRPPLSSRIVFPASGPEFRVRKGIECSPDVFWVRRLR